MGMENFNNTVPEPATPDESERVDDVAKAQTMAEAEKPLRDYAGQFDRAKDAPIRTYSDGGKSAKLNSNRPDMTTTYGKNGVEYAGSAFATADKNTSEEEFRNKLAERAENAKKEAEEAGEKAGEEYEAKQKEEARQEEIKKVKEKLGL